MSPSSPAPRPDVMIESVSEMCTGDGVGARDGGSDGGREVERAALMTAGSLGHGTRLPHGFGRWSNPSWNFRTSCLQVKFIDCLPHPLQGAVAPVVYR